MTLTAPTPSRPVYSPELSRLIAMLRVKRPHGSPTEQAFIEQFLMPLGVQPDAYGNCWLTLGHAPILWSSHVDTCHRKGGEQRLACDGLILSVADPKVSNCLGADCTAGVWLMTEMIAARIPGTYVFHRGEERGGLGSSHIARFEYDRLRGLNAAIAFDRRGTSSIITHQGGQRSCSDAFAESLSSALGLGHECDPAGTFTDTANYTHLIGECTNISIGYAHEHTPFETLDLGYLMRLRDAMLRADFSQLVCEREPGEDASHSVSEYDMDGLHGHSSLYDLVSMYPDAITDFLELNGITAEEIETYLAEVIPF